MEFGIEKRARLETGKTGIGANPGMAKIVACGQEMAERWIFLRRFALPPLFVDYVMWYDVCTWGCSRLGWIEAEKFSIGVAVGCTVVGN